MENRKMKVGDKIWTFSTLEAKVIGPFIVERVLDDTHPWHYAAREAGHSGVTYLRDDNAGTEEEAKKFCFSHWVEELKRMREEVRELIETLVKFI